MTKTNESDEYVTIDWTTVANTEISTTVFRSPQIANSDGKK